MITGPGLWGGNVGKCLGEMMGTGFEEPIVDRKFLEDRERNRKRRRCKFLQGINEFLYKHFPLLMIVVDEVKEAKQELTNKELIALAIIGLIGIIAIRRED